MYNDVEKVAKYSKVHLALNSPELLQEYGYSHLPLCVIDAVFSIGVNYRSTENTVARFCKHVGIVSQTTVHPPEIDAQLSIERFLQINEYYGVKGMAEIVYRNRQRTSPKNGILKAEAVLRFSEALLKFGVNYLQDVPKVFNSRNFESTITSIPGQSSGISLKYFYMLAGSEDFVKPDRMIVRFVEWAIGRTPSADECQELITAASRVLAREYPHITPRKLDYAIWMYQRQKQ